MTTHREVWNHYAALLEPLETDYKEAYAPIFNRQQAEIREIDRQAEINRNAVRAHYSEKIKAVTGRITRKIQTLTGQRDAKLRELAEMETVERTIDSQTGVNR